MKNKKNINFSGFTLSKGTSLKGDDAYGVSQSKNIVYGIVCDGVGSADAGAEAAQRSVKYITTNLKSKPKSWSIEKSIHYFIESINSILYKESQVEYERSELVTTLAMVVIEGNRLYGANVGDSRIYLLRDGKLIQLSQDHTVEEAGYEGVLSAAIGMQEDIEPYYFENNLQKGDILLLCSDGLYTVLNEEEIVKYLPLGATRLVKTASKKVDDDLPDDTTAVVIEIQENNDELVTLKEQRLLIPEKLKAGEVIDGYELKKPLIQNERTWLAHKKTKDYVLKFAPVEAKEDEEILDLFIKEAWNAKRLKAPFFPKAVIPKNRTRRYYVMSYIEGESLERFLQQGERLSIDDTVLLAQTLLQASSFLLKYDLVHGVIKPDNIMITEDENGKKEFVIIDYGSITEIFSTTSKAGTPSFLSPERFLGESISESSEIFAIGVTLYLALTGKYPYGEIEPFQQPVFKEAKPPSHFNPNIPDWLDTIVMRSIAIDPEQRYEHFSEIDFELKNPKKIKPYFKKNATIIEKNPVLFYRSAFIVSFILNLMLLILLLR